LPVDRAPRLMKPAFIDDNRAAPRASTSRGKNRR
jgi:hypothetical protein